MIYSLVRKYVKLSPFYQTVFEFDFNLCRPIVDILMGIKCAPIVSDFFSLVWEKIHAVSFRQRIFLPTL